MVLMVIRQRECVAEAWRAELRTAFKTKTTAATAFLMHDTAFGAGCSCGCSPTPRLTYANTHAAMPLYARRSVLPRKLSRAAAQGK